MKKTIVILSLFASVSGTAQQSLSPNEQPDKKIGFGFHLGLTKSFIELNEKENPYDFNTFGTINKLGVRFGSEINIILNKNLKLHIPLSLIFHNSKISYTEISVTDTISPFQITSELSTELKIDISRQNKKNPYLIFGPNARYFINYNKSNSSSRDIDIALNFGIGLDNKTKFFSFAPEIKYTYGLMKSYANTSSYESINPQLHTLSLILHFRD